MVAALHGGPLQGVHNGHVDGGVKAGRKLGDVQRAWSLPRNEEAGLLDRPETDCRSHLMQVVAQVVVAGYPLAATATFHGVHAQHIAVLAAGGAGAGLTVDPHA